MLAAPGSAPPCHTCQARPDRTSPRLTSACLACLPGTRRASPGQAVLCLACRNVARHTVPQPSTRHRALPAMPSLASPDHAMRRLPRRVSPCLSRLCQSVPSQGRTRHACLVYAGTATLCTRSLMTSWSSRNRDTTTSSSRSTKSALSNRINSSASRPASADRTDPITATCSDVNV
jgi:hypothetical protein